MRQRLLCLASALVLTLAVCAQEAISIQYGPYLQSLKETETTIVWVSNQPSVGWVELAPDDGTTFYQQERRKIHDTTNGVKNVTRRHVVRITGLKPGTAYRYRVVAQEVTAHQGVQVIYGRVAATDIWAHKPLRFVTNDRNKAGTSFVMLNDIHGRTDDIPKLLEVVDYKSADMVLYNGDMVTQTRNEEQLFKSFMNASIDLFAKEKPMYYSRGNHETRGEFATFFQDYFSPKEPHLYFTMRQGPVFFIFLDTGEDKPDSDIDYSGITDYDNYRTEQAEWLEQVVRSDDFREAPYRVVVCHMPPVKWGDELWHGPYEVLQKFVPVLNEARIDVMLCGHYHQSKQTYYYHEPSPRVKFPVLINECVTALRGDADAEKLSVEIKTAEGKSLVTKVFNYVTR